jgi:RHS repeat-associated protein
MLHSKEIDDEDDDDNEWDDDEKETPRTTFYIYDNEDIILEYNERGQITARYTHGPGIDEPLGVEKKKEIYFYHADGLGSVVALTDTKQKIIESYDYDSFGNIKRNGHKVKQPYTFTGREWDKETSLHYYRARYYDSQLGRFTAFDPILRGVEHTESNSCKSSLNALPIHLPQDMNPYIYARNNSINLTDPYGKAPWYGNYCGPGNNPGGPIDELDRACKAHDDCYRDAGLAGARDVIIPPKNPSQCETRNNCDAVLCTSARSFVAINYKQKIARAAIIAIFCR